MAKLYIPIKDQPYLDMYSWEEIDLPYWRNWFQDNWPKGVLLGAAYVSFILIGQRVMKNREAFDLRRPLAIWNFGMAIFSAFAFCRVFPELLYLLRKPDGLYKAACVL
jgi:hypothetical protein